MRWSWIVGGILLVAMGALGEPASRPATTQAAAAPPAVGEKVQAKWDTKWIPGLVLKVDGAKVYVRYDDGFEKWLGPGEIHRSDPPEFAQPAAAPAAAADRGPPVGARVEVKLGARWFAATVLRRDGAKALVHFDRFNDHWNEWVGPERIRRMVIGDGAQQPAAESKPQTPVEPEPPPVSSGDRSEMKELKADRASAWIAKPDATPAPAANLAQRSMNLPIKLNGSERVERLIFTDPRTPVVALVLYAPSFFDDPSKCRVQRVDLATGRPLDLLVLPPRSHLMDLSGDGKLALCRTSAPKSPNCLEVLQIEGTTAKRVSIWKPYDGDEEITLAAFIDDKHVVSCDSGGYFILSEFASGKAIYRLKIGNYIKPVLTPGRKQIAAEAFGKLALFDVLTGDPIGSASEAELWQATVAFSQDGNFLGICGRQKMSILTVADGKIVREIPIPREIAANGSLLWMATGHLLIGRKYLVDPDKRVVSWEYQFEPSSPVVAYGGRVWFVEGATPGSKAISLGSVALPHDAATKAAAAINPDDLALFKPGTPVSIDVQSDATPEIREQIAKSLEKQAAALKLLVKDGQSVRFVASTTTEPAKEMTFQKFGVGVERVSVSEKVHKLAVVLEDKEIWSTTTRSGVGMVVSAKQGQTLQDAIRESQERSYGWLASAKVADYLVKPGAYKPAGTSEVTAKGLE
jgi:hypothetical protein